MIRLCYDEEVVITVLNKFCIVINVDMDDIMKFVPIEENRVRF